MPSAQHEAPLELIRHRAAFGVELLTDLAGIPVPDHHTVTIDNTDLSDVVPAQLLADAVLVLRDAENRPLTGIIIENQLARDNRKRLTWPHYVIALYSRLGCPVRLLVLCPNKTVARWAATPIDFGAGILTPTVLGPDTIPEITEPDTARAAPDLMMLSALNHHHNRAVLRALTTIFAEDFPNHELYDVLSRLALPKRARDDLEELMTALNFPWAHDTEYAREMESRGAAKWQARALVTVLESRGLTITDSVRDRILHTDDQQRFQQWLERAATVPTVEDLFT